MKKMTNWMIAAAALILASQACMGNRLARKVVWRPWAQHGLEDGGFCSPTLNTRRPAET
jgi:hypothetical protein